MQSRRQLLAEGVLVVLTALVGLAFLDQLPAEVAIHFGAAGQPDDYASRSVALALLPALQLGMIALFAVLPRLDPLGENVRAFGRAYDGFVLVVLGFLGYVHALVVLWNVGYQFAVVQALAPAMAVLYYAVGALVEDAEQNWFVGFRTPWTLSSAEVWADTHAIAGKLMRVAGVVVLGALAAPQYAMVFLIGPVAAVALFATVYSYWDYRRIDGSTV